MQIQYKKTPGDGNCCIYAILQNLNIPIEYHHNFREILVNIISNIFMTEGQLKENGYETKAEYINQIKENY